MTQHLDYLDAGSFEERILTKTEIRQRMDEWKAKRKEEPVEEDDTTPLSKAEIAQKLYESRCMSANGDLKIINDAYRQLVRVVGETMANRISTHDLAIRQFTTIVSGLEVEYGGKPNKLIDICMDSRFIVAKKNVESVVGATRAQELFDQIFNQ